MARKTLDEAAKSFLSGEDEVASSKTPKVSTAKSTVKSSSKSVGDSGSLISNLSIAPQEKPVSMTITILPSRREKLEELAAATGRTMSEILGIGLDRLYREASK